MPRVQINYPETSRFEDNAIPAPTGTVRTEPALHVSWSKIDAGSHVQVAFEADPDYLRMAADNPNEGGQGPQGRTTVYTPVLERAHINKLIRTLRQARDQAYGRDE